MKGGNPSDLYRGEGSWLLPLITALNFLPEHGLATALSAFVNQAGLVSPQPTARSSLRT